jgi:hypothetical protein
MRHIVIAAIIGTALGLAVPAGDMAFAESLITAGEAALPPVPDLAITTRGLTRGPAIEQIAPAPEAKNVKSPLAFKVGFAAHNNASVDPNSVKVTYIKAQAVDLTARVKAHVTPNGIDMNEADVPPGDHVIRIDLKDSQGRASTAIVKFSVTGK